MQTHWHGLSARVQTAKSTEKARGSNPLTDVTHVSATTETSPARRWPVCTQAARASTTDRSTTPATPSNLRTVATLADALTDTSSAQKGRAWPPRQTADALGPTDRSTPQASPSNPATVVTLARAPRPATSRALNALVCSPSAATRACTTDTSTTTATLSNPQTVATVVGVLTGTSCAPRGPVRACPTRACTTVKSTTTATPSNLLTAATLVGVLTGTSYAPRWRVSASATLVMDPTARSTRTGSRSSLRTAAIPARAPGEASPALKWRVSEVALILPLASSMPRAPASPVQMAATLVSATAATWWPARNGRVWTADGSTYNNLRSTNRKVHGLDSMFRLVLLLLLKSLYSVLRYTFYVSR